MDTARIHVTVAASLNTPKSVIALRVRFQNVPSIEANGTLLRTQLVHCLEIKAEEKENKAFPKENSTGLLERRQRSKKPVPATRKRAHPCHFYRVGERRGGFCFTPWRVQIEASARSDESRAWGQLESRETIGDNLKQIESS